MLCPPMAFSSVSSSLPPSPGTFIPLMLMWPVADIPVVQLSMAASLDPQVPPWLGLVAELNQGAIAPA